MNILVNLIAFSLKDLIMVKKDPRTNRHKDFKERGRSIIKNLTELLSNEPTIGVGMELFFFAWSSKDTIKTLKALVALFSKKKIIRMIKIHK